MDGAKAAAEQMSELKRLTRSEYETRLKFSGSSSTEPGDYDTDRLRALMAPLKGDEP
jgi:hypothetical protein